MGSRDPSRGHLCVYIHMSDMYNHTKNYVDMCKDKLTKGYECKDIEGCT